MLEARAGIEPANGAFAELCLTTWLPRREYSSNRDGESKLDDDWCQWLESFSMSLGCADFSDSGGARWIQSGWDI